LSKLEGEQVLADASQHRNIATASLRIAAPYGPGQRFRTVLSIFVDAAVNGRDLLIVHGSGKSDAGFHACDRRSGRLLAGLRAPRVGSLLQRVWGQPSADGWRDSLSWRSRVRRRTDHGFALVRLPTHKTIIGAFFRSTEPGGILVSNRGYRCRKV
jgi:hypothetical protein